MSDERQDGDKTLRLLMPEWQGGNRIEYVLGERILELMVPAATGPVEEVPVDMQVEGVGIEDGIFARQAVLRQQRAAAEILRRHGPDRVLVLGGPCNVSVPPFAYLNGRYDGDLAIVWLDAHPDLSDPSCWPNHHAMALASLMGLGDEQFAREVEKPIAVSHVLHVGVRSPVTWPPDEGYAADDPRASNYGVPRVTADEATESSAAIIEWLAGTGCAHVAVHFDLDVLDPSEFRSLLGPEPGGLTIEAAGRVIGDVASACDLVGLTIAEHLPVELQRLSDMLHGLPFVRRT